MYFLLVCSKGSSSIWEKFRLSRCHLVLCAMPPPVSVKIIPCPNSLQVPNPDPKIDGRTDRRTNEQCDSLSSCRSQKQVEALRTPLWKYLSTVILDVTDTAPAHSRLLESINYHGDQSVTNKRMSRMAPVTRSPIESPDHWRCLPNNVPVPALLTPKPQYLQSW